MIADEIRNAVKRDPFTPFRVFPSSGEAYEVHSPDLVVPMRNTVFIAMPQISFPTIREGASSA